MEKIKAGCGGKKGGCSLPFTKNEAISYLILANLYARKKKKLVY